VEMYEDILVELRDAIQVVRDGLNSEKEQSQGAKGKPSLLLSYLLYLRLRLTNARTELMIEEKANPKDCIRLLEMILHNYQEMLTIPGLEADEEFESEIHHLNFIFKARRCQYLALIYMANKKWGVGFKLYNRSVEYAEKAAKGLPADSPHLKTVEKIKAKAESSRLESRSRAVVSNTSKYGLATEFTKPEKQLLDRLDEFVYDESLTTKEPNLVRPFPCDFKAIPTKPVFFDLAGHQINFPEEELEAKVRGQSPKKSGKEGAGITGFVKGLWGWGSK